MLTSLKIENYRRFQAFELQQLGRVNLLVGKNNSGKTSVLEAIQLLLSRTDFEPLVEIMNSRGEYLPSNSLKTGRELNICHLFHSHQIQKGSQLVISGLQGGELERLTLAIHERLFDEETELFDERLSVFDDERLNLLVQWMHGQETRGLKVANRKLPLSSSSGLLTNYVQRSRKDAGDLPITTQFVTPSSLNTSRMIKLFDQIVLTPEEALINQALQTIEPKIERIASVGSERFSSSDRSRRGFVVKLSGVDERVPVGSMGDGMWRVLGLALSIICAKGGVLLVDEIDTGLHFSTMFDMWKMIWETAKRLNVQVFATTHNSDCWMSLAEIANSQDTKADGITIQRIERDKPNSVIFNERQMAIAAERNIEIR